MKRCIYGLNSWYKRVNHGLTKLKGIVSAYNNNALFLWYDATGNLMEVLAMHVDDFVFGGNDFFKKKCDCRIKKDIQSWNTWKCNIWGLGVRQTKEEITIT